MKALRSRSLYICIVAVLGLISCRTLPEKPLPDVVHWLPSDLDLVIQIKVAENKELTAAIFSAFEMEFQSLEFLLNRTTLLAVGMESAMPGTPAHRWPFHLVAVGKWPRGLINGALGSEWEKDGPYRWNGPNTMQLSAPSRHILLLSHGRLDAMLARSMNPTMDLQRQQIMTQGADASILISDMGFLTEKTVAFRGGIEQAAVLLNHAPEDAYRMDWTLFPTNEKFVGSLALALRIGLAAELAMSSDPLKQALFSGIDVEVFEESVHVFFPDVTLPFLQVLLAEFVLFPER